MLQYSSSCFRVFFNISSSCFTKTASKPFFNLFYEDEEFSILKYGSLFYSEVVKKLLESRISGEAYDIYVTDIDLSPAIINMTVNSLQTSRYLYFKRKIKNLK